MSAALANSSPKPDERPRGPRRAASSYQRRASPSLGYSTLTTRSQSLSRLSLDGRLLTADVRDSGPYSAGGAITPTARTAGVGVVAGQYDTDAYHAWRRNGKEHALLARARKAGGDAGDFALPTNSARRGKGKGKERAAVAFVVGIPSSSEDGATDSDGASSEPSGPSSEERDAAAAAAGPSIQDIIRFQVRIRPARHLDERTAEPIETVCRSTNRCSKSIRETSIRCSPSGSETTPTCSNPPVRPRLRLRARHRACRCLLLREAVR